MKRSNSSISMKLKPLSERKPSSARGGSGATPESTSRCNEMSNSGASRISVRPTSPAAICAVNGRTTGSRSTFC